MNASLDILPIGRWALPFGPVIAGLLYQRTE